MSWNLWIRKYLSRNRRGLSHNRCRAKTLNCRRPQFDRLEERTLLAGTITGQVFEDFNSNGLFDSSRVAVNDSGNGNVGLASDRGLGGVTVTAFDSAGNAQGSAATTAIAFALCNLAIASEL